MNTHTADKNLTINDLFVGAVVTRHIPYAGMKSETVLAMTPKGRRTMVQTTRGGYALAAGERFGFGTVA